MRASITFFILGWLFLLIGLENGIRPYLGPGAGLATGIGLPFELGRTLFFFWMILAGASFIYNLRVNPERRRRMSPGP